MPDELKYDLEYRPKSYWIAEATKARLARVTGQARREIVQALLDQGFAPLADDPMLADVLPRRQREALGRIHPAMMGGEYLPRLLKGEVEIARIVLASTTMDVVSLRARRVEGRIRYRMVGEYGDQGYRYRLRPRSSKAPLSFRELVGLLDGVRLFVEDEEMDGSPAGYVNSIAGESPDSAFDFVEVSSPFYPQLEEWYGEALTELALEYHFDVILEDLVDSEWKSPSSGPAVDAFLKIAKEAVRLASAGVTGEDWERRIRRKARKGVLALPLLRRVVEAALVEARSEEPA